MRDQGYWKVEDNTPTSSMRCALNCSLFKRSSIPIFSMRPIQKHCCVKCAELTSGRVSLTDWDAECRSLVSIGSASKRLVEVSITLPRSRLDRDDLDDVPEVEYRLTPAASKVVVACWLRLQYYPRPPGGPIAHPLKLMLMASWLLLTKAIPMARHKKHAGNNLGMFQTIWFAQ